MADLHKNTASSEGRHLPGASVAEDRRLVEALLEEMDPVQDGFHGVSIELWSVAREAGLPPVRYEVVQTAITTGNQLMRFTTRHERRALELYSRLTGPLPRTFC